MVSFLQGKVFTVITFLSSNASLNRSGVPFIWFGKLNASWGIQNHVGFKLEFLCTVPSAFPGPQGMYLNEKNVRKWWIQDILRLYIEQCPECLSRCDPWIIESHLDGITFGHISPKLLVQMQFGDQCSNVIFIAISKSKPLYVRNLSRYIPWHFSFIFIWEIHPTE